MKLITAKLLVAALTTANSTTVFADDESVCGAVLCLAGAAGARPRLCRSAVDDTLGPAP